MREEATVMKSHLYALEQGEFCNMTFSTAADIWLESKRNEVKESSFAQYRRNVEQTLKPMLGNTMLACISEKDLNSLGEQLLDKYADKTARSVIVTVNQILAHAYVCGFTPNLYKGSIKIKTGKVSRPQVFSVMEQKALTNCLINNIDLKKLGVLICMYTGLRLGEICGLKWSDIDLKRGIIKIARTIQRISDGEGSTRFLIGTPKSEASEREIPIPEFLQELLISNVSSLECYVITGTEQFMQPRTYQNILKRYFSDCDMPGYHFHTLRHTFASRAIEIGFDPKSLSEILGHSNVRITLDLYVHPSMEAKKREMERFSSFVEFT